MDIKNMDKLNFARKSQNKGSEDIKTIGNQFKCLIGGVSIGYAITVIIFIFYAILLTYTNLSDKNMDIVVIITTVLSVMIAGFDTTKNANSKGLMWGVLAGLLYAMILLFVSTLIDGKMIFDAETIITFLVAMASGGIGGIIGINKK